MTTQAENQRSEGLEEITVTARRTKEALQTVPIAVTAIGAERLQQNQIQMITDLQRSAPNLSIGAGGAGPSTVVYVYIRGSGQIAPSSTSDPSVGIYVDGVYYARPTGGNLNLFDVAQAEVLRGPQGTLFGRNTTGGAISITTKQPTDQFEGVARAEFGNYDTRRLEGVVNVPLSDNDLALRLSGRYTEHGGYGRFVNIDRAASKLDSDYYTRAALRWAPRDRDFVVTIAADYEKLKDGGKLDAVIAVNPNYSFGGALTLGSALNSLGFDPAPYIVNKDNFYKNYGYGDTGDAVFDTPSDTSVSKGISGTLDWEIGDMNFKSITAYRITNTSDSQDLDALPVAIASSHGIYRDKQFSEEAQISGDIGHFKWIGGAYYFIEKGYEETNTVFLPSVFGNVVQQSSSGNTRNVSYALFGQVNYNFTDQLRATAGLRYTWDKRQLVLHTRRLRDDLTSCSVNRDVANGPCNETKNASFSYPAWTVGLDFQATNNMFVYGKTSGASVAGGWNIRTTIAPAFEPENLRDIEVGFKLDMLNRKLRTNVALFYAWQSDVQRLVNFATGAQTLTASVINAGKAHIRGIEAEAIAVPWSGMEINTSVAYQKANYVDGSFTEPQVVNGVVVKVDRSGELIPNTPKFTASIGATQKVPLSFGTASFHADYAYISSRAFFQNTAADSASQAIKNQYAFANKYGVLDGYGLLNMRAGLDLDSPNIELALFARNIAKKKYYSGLSNFLNSFGVASATQGEPRTYGISVGYRW